MNVAVIVEYFEYFLSFPRCSAKNAYFFCTVRNKHVRRGAENVAYCNWKDFAACADPASGAAWREYFKTGLRLGTLSNRVDYRAVACLYEKFFREFFGSNRIGMLVTGGTTGFERCGIATAKKMGIATLCVWEGQFRPDTISYDPDGMNAESAFYRLPFSRVMAEPPSDGALRYVRDYAASSLSDRGGDSTLRRIHRGRFDILRQAEARWKDRNDLERIRLPLRQHALARMEYWNSKKAYAGLSDVTGPYIFFPLQTHTDSNIAINSDAVPFTRCVDTVIAAFRKAYAGTPVKLLIKEHPFDVFRLAYDKERGSDVRWCHPAANMRTLLTDKNCLGVVVVNSTAGFESLLAGKPVAALGKSFYAHPELVELPEALDVRHIAESLARLAQRNVDRSVVEPFAARLFEETQCIGNMERVPDLEDVVRFERLLEKFVPASAS